MDIDKMIIGLDSYFKNTLKEHLQKVYDELKAYNQYGSIVEEYLDGINSSVDNAPKVKVELLRESNQNAHMFHLT